MKTIPDAFLTTVGQHRDVVALVDGTENGSTITYGQCEQRVARMVSGLRNAGIGRGDRIALLLENCVEFHVADLAAQFAGAVPLSIYTASTPDQIAFILQDSGASLLLASPAFLHSARQAVAGVHGVRLSIVGDDTWKSFETADPSDLEDDAQGVTSDDCATIIYTSGTTGPPKGVMLSQGNVYLNAAGYIERSGCDVTAQRMVSYLPMAHIAERIVSFYAAIGGAMTVWPCNRVSEMPAYLRSVRPHALFGVPLVWERLQSTIQSEVDAHRLLSRAFAWSQRASASWIPGVRQSGRVVRKSLGRAIKRKAGLNQLRYAASGGAGIDASVITWFRQLGVPLTESYGMSESTGPMTWTPGTYRAGAAGRSMPGVTVKIARDGEILCKGPTVFMGYWRDADRTHEIMKDGWLHTGDLGTVDRRGFISVSGRKKDLIVTRGGENYSPANIEAALTSHALIANACVVGNDRPFLVALLVLDTAQCRLMFERAGLPFHSLAQAARHERIISAAGNIVDTVNQGHSRGEQIRRFKVLDHSWDGDFEVLTGTMKPKRKAILHRYAVEIDALYTA